MSAPSVDPIASSGANISSEDDISSEEPADEIGDVCDAFANRVGKQNLTNDQRRIIYDHILKLSDGGKFTHGSILETSKKFNVSRKTVSRIWSQGQASSANGLFCADVSSKKTGRVGRKKAIVTSEQVRQIPLQQRTNIRSMASALNLSASTVHARIKEGILKPHSNALKPFLTEENKKARLRFCISMVISSPTHDPVFQDMMNIVHIDEKWFYMTETTKRVYLAADENEPHRTCKSKRFITKVMFMAAVARPRYDRSQNQWFSGKLGIFPFVYQEPAKRSSKNRPAGTMVTKAIESVNKDVIRRCLIDQVVPAIRSKWPRLATKNIIIQQDNARPHISPSDEQFKNEAEKDGFEIKLTFQPPNSPDMNVLDLGFFRAIQSLQHQQAPKDIDELIQAVTSAFYRMDREKLNDIFLTLQQCMVEVMRVKGGNNYKLPHMGKESLRRQGILPDTLPCDRGVLEQSIADLSSLDNASV
jgi:hypothetical protein